MLVLIKVTQLQGWIVNFARGTLQVGRV